MDLHPRILISRPVATAGHHNGTNVAMCRQQAQSLCVDSGILNTMPVIVQLFIPAVDQADAPSHGPEDCSPPQTQVNGMQRQLWYLLGLATWL